MSLAKECGISPTALALRSDTSPFMQRETLCVQLPEDVADCTIHLQVTQQALCMIYASLWLEPINLLALHLSANITAQTTLNHFQIISGPDSWCST